MKKNLLKEFEGCNQTKIEDFINSCSDENLLVNLKNQLDKLHYHYQGGIQNYVGNAR